jgi:pimeloyl-ACP methyl ester carboxylesterase
MLKIAAIALSASLLATSALAAVQPFPASFKSQTIAANGTKIFVRVGGHGPAVVMLHGYGETGDMVGYAFVAEEPERVTHLVLMDAPIPGVGPWEEILKNPLLWHFRFGGPDMERLVKGRERIYLDRFWNEFSADPKNFDEASRVHYAALYARPLAMHDGFEQFHAFDQDAIDNKVFLAKGPLTMPVLAIGGEKSFGPTMAVVARAAATNVQGAVIPKSGHWVMEENPTATVAAVSDFLR